MHITFLALSPTVWVIGTIIFFVTTLIVSLILYRNAHVGQRTIAEQHEQIAEQKRTITQQQQIIDDLRKQPVPRDDTPARRTEGAKVGWEIRKAKQAQKGEAQ